MAYRQVVLSQTVIREPKIDLGFYQRRVKSQRLLELFCGFSELCLLHRLLPGMEVRGQLIFRRLADGSVSNEKKCETDDESPSEIPEDSCQLKASRKGAGSWGSRNRRADNRRNFAPLRHRGRLRIR